MLIDFSRRRFWFCLVLVVWAIFSIGYIAWDQVTRFKEREMAGAYAQGRTQAVNELLSQSQDCKPIPITVDGKVVQQFIAVSCLQQKPADANTQPPAPSDTKPAR